MLPAIAAHHAVGKIYPSAALGRICLEQYAYFVLGNYCLAVVGKICLAMAVCQFGRAWAMGIDWRDEPDGMARRDG